MTKPAGTERPTNLYPHEVRGILDGRQTQVRRIVKPQPPAWVTEARRIGPWVHFEGDHPKGRCSAERCACINEERGGPAMWTLKSPHGVRGDHLWSRETWCGPTDETGLQIFGYRATDDYTVGGDCGKGTIWRPSIHMPRKISRITLEITGIRVERLNQITVEDIIAEGLSSTYREHDACCDLRDKFTALWDEINGKKAPWSSDPFVWVIEFRKVKEAA